MREKRFSFEGIFHSKLFFTVSFIIFILVVFALGKEFLQHHQINKEVIFLENEVEKSEARHKELLELVQYFNTEFFIEHEARSKLGLKKPGENVVVVPDEEENTQDRSFVSQSKDFDKVIPNFKKWWRYFSR
ncbi:MAG: hypothetical protein COY82_01780 [Parcubacteria group bacterium CG_4_10_14_0_8_um_filter_35_7]|nr:MAG: hypothetical protein COX43_04090 [Parcubacteria group bacterium CG23_combo_of_CG06-09_8_20_14_all_35_9]PIY78572.1 MAG: hypothetical protein COY82_01780 [Parcubacteria group bacterium CG_4_10_14_0_8_um_filter_35_7]